MTTAADAVTRWLTTSSPRPVTSGGGGGSGGLWSSVTPISAETVSGDWHPIIAPEEDGIGAGGGGGSGGEGGVVSPTLDLPENIIE